MPETSIAVKQQKRHGDRHNDGRLLPVQFPLSADGQGSQKPTLCMAVNFATAPIEEA